MGRFRADHPGIAITMTIADSRAALAQVADGLRVQRGRDPLFHLLGRQPALGVVIAQPRRHPLPVGVRHPDPIVAHRASPS